MKGKDPRDKNSSIESFGAQSDAYREARPTYPLSLFSWIRENAPDNQRALDCATGNGQAAVALASYFDLVDAFDIHKKQIASAIPAHNIHYKVAKAEKLPYQDHCFDVITCAQAVHWFDHPNYWREMQRVAKPNALYCAFGYNRFLASDAMENTLIRPILDVVQPYWSDRNLMVWDGYDPVALKCPLDLIDIPVFKLELNWSVERFIAFMESWSATRKARANTQLNEQLDQLIADFLAHNAADEVMHLSSDLFTLAARFR